MKRAVRLYAGLFLLGALLLAAGLYLLLVPQGGSFGVLDEASLLRIPADRLPDDTLYISYDRRLYGQGEMWLIIPAIGVDTPVGDSTLPDGLRRMPGLYEFAQMPHEADGNVSIAGHRDVYGMEFYALDALVEGDELYLLHDGVLYRYLLRETRIVAPDDWSVIKPRGFSALTLSTCDPIGTTLNRLIVTAELVDATPYDSDFDDLPTGGMVT